MRKNQVFGGEEEENEINLTPMLDVVFIMLIFFIVTASFIKEARHHSSRKQVSTWIARMRRRPNRRTTPRS
jgi:biopolymer transport protein ExbD